LALQLADRLDKADEVLHLFPGIIRSHIGEYIAPLAAGDLGHNVLPGQQVHAIAPVLEALQKNFFRGLQV